MANRRYNGYQYETSPKKLEPYYERKPKKYPKKTTAKVTSKKKNEDKKHVSHEDVMNKVKAITYIVAVFSVLLFISYKNSKIDASFAVIQDLKKQVSEITKENEQLEISIQNSLNLSNIEQAAKERLGMQKLSNKQIVYINLPKKDYVEPSTEEVIIEEEPSFIEKILNHIKNIF